MKRYIILITMVLFSQLLNAQDNIKAISKIQYEFKHVDDTSQPDNPYVEDVFVLMSQDVSIQKSLTVQNVRNSINDMIYHPKKNEQGMVVFGVPKIDKDASSYEYLNNIKDKEYVLLNNIYDTYYIIDQDYPVINWELLNEQKIIGGYNCQKAKGLWKGRTYIAWFTLEIPQSFGPWKLHGLPGLILEAEDEKKEVSWSYAGFETVKDTVGLINYPKKAIKTNEAKFNKLYDALKKNPDAAFKAAQAASPTGQVMLTNMYVTGFSSGKHKKENYKAKVINNPIEILKK
ncbi:GLPGLI family protein [Pedobacter metabolipauper]|uniref:GLPGLI family protein n=1 Tax=Pedobacter metabolipauper TaxID=425513 RepID=A0A4R6SYS3_9SPHI|nr:GLPGLI family protein [Pedobacter metabolipauper]TDQ11754.1 GLPGLI family protein [Pedobacter metabolipauper]